MKADIQVGRKYEYGTYPFAQIVQVLGVGDKTAKVMLENGQLSYVPVGDLRP